MNTHCFNAFPAALPVPIAPGLSPDGSIVLIPLIMRRRRRAASILPIIPDAQIRPLTASCLAIRKVLVDSGLFTPARVIVSTDPEPFTSPSPPCCAVAPGGHSFDSGFQSGGGRYLSVTDSEFIIRVIVRHTKDYASQDLRFLTDPTKGSYPLIEAVVDVLNEVFLFDGSGNKLTSVGLKPVRVGEMSQYGADPTMGVVPITFSTRVMIRPTLPYLT